MTRSVSPSYNHTLLFISNLCHPSVLFCSVLFCSVLFCSALLCPITTIYARNKDSRLFLLPTLPIKPIYATRYLSCLILRLRRSITLLPSCSSTILGRASEFFRSTYFLVGRPYPIPPRSANSTLHLKSSSSSAESRV
jgi:hypothetical protein